MLVGVRVAVRAIWFVNVPSAVCSPVVSLPTGPSGFKFNHSLNLAHRAALFYTEMSRLRYTPCICLHHRHPHMF